ncbi:unnamed protein product [Darwinula stevensoni]|uniref:GATOR2 complex protein WDR24 n=1 Tax=Darwinula stevensoni TaxID=69355 RepID=A0A7R8ZY20_9CRUS|nr:unnamed protein product [Darwinula stevensoni]CAG0879574.1 unnamed protein product [Darwinula stevensoni]
MMAHVFSDGAMNARTFHTVQEAAANALALNRDYSQVVIAGRSVFKVFSIEDEAFQEKANLRVSEKRFLNLNYSSIDVVWNALDGKLTTPFNFMDLPGHVYLLFFFHVMIADNILATAATNGAVVLWNLGRSSRSKQEHVFNDHKRTVNKVSFHPSEAQSLLSGSQDGTMKFFDLRKKEAVITFHSNAESVRDVEFNPHNHSKFAAVSENGTVGLWDLRKTERAERQFTAHSGPIFTCDWHPENRNWLATAGRDKTIKAGLECRAESLFRTYSSDNSFCWSHQVETCKKDHTLYQHAFRDAQRPAEKAKPMALSMGVRGEICWAKKIPHPDADQRASLNRFNPFFRRASGFKDQFVEAKSEVYMYQIMEPLLSQRYLADIAKGYILSGKSFTEICEHNAAVARHAKREQVSMTWHIVRHLYASPTSESSKGLLSLPFVGSGSGGGRIGEGVMGTGAGRVGDVGGDEDRGDSRHHSGEKGSDAGGLPPGAIFTQVSEDLDSDVNATDDGDIIEKNLFNMPGGGFGGGLMSDNLFCDVEDPMVTTPSAERTNSFSLTSLDVPHEEDWTLPSEAFQPRHEIQDRSPPPEEFSSTHAEIQDAEVESSSGSNILEANDILSLPGSGTQSAPSWDFSPLVIECLHFYAELGDVQTAVSLLLVLGDRVRNAIPKNVQESWCEGYLEILSRLRLFNVATQVIELCTLPSIHSLNHQSTVYHTKCPQCDHLLVRSGWACDRCRQLTNTCSVCHQVVRGLYVWCQGCGHGGHMTHLKDWFSQNTTCPTGCQHLCSF